MRDQPDLSSPPPALQRVAFTLRTIGRISFWLQLVLGVVSALILLFATFSQSVSNRAGNQGTGFGIFFAICGLVTLAVGIYFAFRYTRLAGQLTGSNGVGRPSKADTLQLIRLGLIVNLVGMLLTIIGAQAIVGSILARSFSLPQGGVPVYGVPVNQYVQSLDLLVVQANTNTVAAHFAGIAASLWLFNRVSR